MKAAEPLVRSRCASEYLTREEKEDLAQTLRLAVVESLRKWNPSRNDRFSSFLVMTLQTRAYDFISSSSRIGYTAERRLSSDKMDEQEKRQALSLRSTLPFDEERHTAYIEPGYAAVEEEKTPSLFDRIAEHVQNPQLVETIVCLMEGQNRHTMRARLHVSWTRLDQLVDEARQLLEDWAQQPPDWLRDSVLARR